MARVTAAEVKEIIATALTGTALDPFITIANQLVTNLLGNKASLTDAIRKEIERWLSAHYVAIYENLNAGRGILSFGGIKGSENKQPGIGVGLKNSSYGLTAIELDITGTLVNLGNKTASVSIINSPDIS